MSIRVENPASAFHRPLLHKGRLIQTDGCAIVSRKHPKGKEATATVDKKIADAVADTKATTRPPDVILNPELLSELIEEMGGGYVAIWAGSDVEKPVMLHCKDRGAFGLLMPIQVQNVGPLNVGE